MRVWIAIIIGKICAVASRFLGRGGGSSLPGVLARYIEPRILARLLERVSLTSIVITGSNGKTTTARMVAEVLIHNGLRIVWNRSGANMVSGIISTLIERCDIWGRFMADVGVFEVDEANLKYVIPAMKPEIILITNCFRDQLDRYGEVDTTLGLIRTALEGVSFGTILLLNADDPLITSLATVEGCNVLFYGIEDAGQGQVSRAVDINAIGYRPQDARTCPRCGSYYEYSQVTYGHLGKYLCPACGASRPVPDFRGLGLVSHGTRGFTFTIAFVQGGDDDFMNISLGLPGLYNVYNCLAAVACCLVLGIPKGTIEEGIAKSSSAFGRMETLEVGGRNVLLALVKNPVGLSEVIRTISSDGSGKTLLMCLNDNFADGRDISWVWDADVEQLSLDHSFVRAVIASGTRAFDMALRLKYAGIEQDKIYVEQDFAGALQFSLGSLASGETLYVLPTYTAMLEVRELVRRRSHAREFWRA